MSLRKVKEIFESGLEGSKKLTTAGAELGRKAGVGTNTVNPNTIAHNLAKWGIPTAAITAGAFTIPTAFGSGIGNGVGNLSDGVKEAFEFDFSSLDGIIQSGGKMVSWVFFGLLVLLAVWAAVKLIDSAKKGGKK